MSTELIYIVIPFMSVLLSTYALGYVYSLDRRKPLNRAFCLFTLFGIAWGCLAFFLYLPVDPAFFNLIIKTATLTWIPGGVLLMNFTYVILKKQRDAGYWLLAAITIPFLAVGPFTDLIVTAPRRFSWGYWHTDGPLFIPTLAITITLPTLYSLYHFFRRLVTIKNRDERLPLVFLLLGPFLNLIAGLGLEVIIPRYIDPSFVRLSPSSMVLSSLLVLFAIRKYQVLSPDIRDMTANIFSTVRDGVILINNSGEIIQMNAAAAELFGPVKNGSLASISELIDGYDPAREYKDHEVEMALAGEKRTILITRSAIAGEEGPSGAMLTIKDITPIKKLFREVQRSEERFRFLVEDITETIFSIQNDGTIDYISPVIKSITGWDPEEVVGRPFRDFIHPDDLASAVTRFYESLNGIPRQYEFRVRSKDGSYKNVISSSKRIYHDGEIYGVRGVLTNITDLKTVKQKLEESQRLYRLIANSIIDKIWIYDLRQMKVTYTSPGVLRLNGRTPEEEMNTPLEERIRKDSLSHVLGILAEELQHDAERDPDRQGILEFTEKHKDGRWIQTEATITFLRDEDGRPIQVLGVSRDITERKNLEEELKKSFTALKQRNDLIEKDLSTAKLIHRKLLPSSIPLLDQFRIDYRYLPLEAVGGDYFNFINLKEGGLGVFVGDVTGHGVSAALFLSLVKSVTNTLFRDHALDPGEFMFNLNNELFRHMQSYFITAIYGLFRHTDDGRNVHFTFANGGHPHPILYRAADGTAETLYARGTAIGAFEDSRYSTNHIVLSKGDRIYCYTDGIVEVLNEQGAILGYDALPGLIRNTYDRDLNRTLDAIIREIHRFRGKAPLDDDIVLLGIEVL